MSDINLTTLHFWIYCCIFLLSLLIGYALWKRGSNIWEVVVIPVVVNLFSTAVVELIKPEEKQPSPAQKVVIIPQGTPDNNDLSVEVACVYMPTSEVNFYDCLQQMINAKQPWRIALPACESKRPYPRRWEEGNDYSGFLWIKNTGNTPVNLHKSYLAISNNTSYLNAKYKTETIVRGGDRVVTFKQRLLNTTWTPTKAAICISGSHEDRNAGWRLYIGKPWTAGLSKELTVEVGMWGAETPVYKLIKKGDGESIDECIDLANKEMRKQF